MTDAPAVGVELTTQNSWLPTRKWIGTQVVAILAVATMAVSTGGWDAEESIAAIGVLTQASVGYFLKNEATAPDREDDDEPLLEYIPPKDPDAGKHEAP